MNRDLNNDPSRDPTPHLHGLFNRAMKREVLWEQVHSVNRSIFWS